MRSVYLDNNATTPVLPASLAAMTQVLTRSFGNPSSAHGWGREVRLLVDRARQSVAGLIGARPSTIIFTSGGTESDNLALRGVFQQTRGHLIVSAIEHHAVLEEAEALTRDRPDWLTVIPVGPAGVVDAGEVVAALREDTVLVSIMLANNETGAVQPVEEIARVCRERGVLCHTDAVQAIGKRPVLVEELGVDMLTLSGHKFGGPKGAGALYLRRGVKLASAQHGGGQERAVRPGTENVAGIVGLAAAAEVVAGDLEAESRRLGALRDGFEESLLGRVEGVQINGPREGRVPNTSSLTIADVEAEALLLALDTDGIAVSAGSACTTGAMAPSHVLTAMGLSSEQAHSTVRLAWGRTNDEDDRDYALERMVAAIGSLRELAALR